MYFAREKDIEDFIYKRPGTIETSWATARQWISRQYRVPSGIIDLLGVATLNYVEGNRIVPIVVEIKNTPIKSKDLAQVCRYANDINKIMSIRDYSFETDTTVKVVLGVGDVSQRVQYEAYAMNVYLKTIRYAPEPDISGTWGWTKEYLKKIEDEIKQAAYSSLFDIFGGNDSKDFEEFLDEKYGTKDSQ